MFLLERIIGICTFSIILFIFVNLISKSPNIKSTKKILIIYLIFLFAMGYFYYPYKTADLNYIYNLIENNLVYKNFGEIILKFKDSGYSLFYVYYWIFGVIGNIKLLPAFTALFFYSNIFYILYKSCIKFDLSPKTMAKTLLFFMAGGQFLEVISGIKSMFALSVVALCCYKELVENKSFFKNLPLYIFAALMHDAALIAVGFRLVYLLFQKEKNFFKKIGHYLIFIIFLFFVIKYGSEIIINATSKGQMYISGDVYHNYWEYTIAFLCDAFMIYSAYLMRKIIKQEPETKNSISKILFFVIILLIFDMAFIFEYSIFQRYRTFIMMLIIPIVAILFEKNAKSEYKFLKKYYFRFQLFFVICMAISLIRGNLSSLKFFDFTK